MCRLTCEYLNTWNITFKLLYFRRKINIQKTKGVQDKVKFSRLKATLKKGTVVQFGNMIQG